ncbi:MAG: type II secretion system inner membrane protein GspF [Syntrophales bacterium]|nr:type II secretion system inner membrane protein GspF [Syntrophales bacterium]
MPVYEYVALDLRGRKKKGLLEAETLSHAQRKLRTQQVYPVKLREVKERKETHLISEIFKNWFSRVSLREITALTRQLSTLIGAGLPLVTSLDVLVSQTSENRLRKVLAQLKDSINEGNSLTHSLSQFPMIFNHFYVNMVKAGELSGALPLVLERLAEYLERQEILRSKIRSALAYPTLMFFIGFAVLFFLVSFVVPNITRIFQDTHQRLPVFSLMLISVSGFLEKYWWVLLAAFAGAIVFVQSYLRTNQGRRIWDEGKIKIPILGPVFEQIYLARFSRTLGTLLQSDVPLLQALEITRPVINNEVFSEIIRKAVTEVEEGRSLAEAISKNGRFPPLVLEMIAVGEQSGALEKMLFRTADALEREVEMKISVFTSLLEPVMILIMGFVVGFIVISILLPIFEMNQLVR